MKIIVFPLLAAAAAIVLLAGIAAPQEVEDETEYSYLTGSDNGPERWSLLHEEWAICNHGEMQSPIDLSHRKVDVVHDHGGLNRTYWPAPTIIRNRGHDIMLKWTNDSGGLWLNGTQYKLKQLHWHSPSEHTLNGKRFKLELHMVHESDDGRIAAVGILYGHGRPDPFLAKMEKYIHIIKDSKGKEEVAAIVNPGRIAMGGKKYYRYIGSLTTPPCTEGVVWTIFRKVRTVSKEQMQLLRDAVDDHMENNARPEQLVNDRRVQYFLPRRDGQR